ncbi:MAG: catalase [Ancylobacter novellus]|uniref:Catalase n=1 Tax=Ancylobacter novellus TaxID=921 RepID=A0A2W5MBI3_ANCNO|nr:MAG: catalase [Ancylobacter novellus]
MTIAEPVAYTPSLERAEENEDEVRRDLIETLRSISETTFENSGHAIRSVHAKSHALLDVEVEVFGGLPEPLAQGLFARPSRYAGVMRLSTNPGDMLDDSVSAPRGLALKVIGVEGERLPGSRPDDRTQDFLMANAPAFAAPNAAEFLKTLKLLAKTTDRAEGAKKALSGVLRAAEAVMEAFGGKSPTLVALGGQALTHVLGETFFSQTPFLYGRNVAKFSIAPVSEGLKALEDEKISIDGRADAHRDEVNAFFRDQGGEWELRAQLMTDPEAMPIEDASVEWRQDRSPYVAVARIRAERQDGWSEQKARRIDDGLSFSPWHGLAAHRPLGSINRVRKENYESSTNFRAERNGCPIHEPRAAGG